MIERVTIPGICPSDAPTFSLRRDGRLLASAVDPAAEAREWVSRRSEFLETVKTIFVLGAGAGYHVAELVAKTSASIVVIEPDRELVEEVLELHAFDSGRVRFEMPVDLKSLRASEAARNGVKQSFVVLVHGPSTYASSDFFRDARQLLLGRDWGSLNWQWKLKGLGPLEDAPMIGSASSRPLTIYDLEQTELMNDSKARERMLLKALRELVK